VDEALHITAQTFCNVSSGLKANKYTLTLNIELWCSAFKIPSVNLQ
jgi:hypothetical protein